MTNILTTTEAASVLRCKSTDTEMLALLPLIDKYIENASGHKWADDSIIRDEAKNAARMLLVMWYENPAMQASGVTSLDHGLKAAIIQLQAIAQHYQHFEGINGAGYIWLKGVYKGDVVESVSGVVAISGDQASCFETVISESGYLKQISGSDLRDKWFRAYITRPSEQ